MANDELHPLIALVAVAIFLSIVAGALNPITIINLELLAVLLWFLVVAGAVALIFTAVSKVLDGGGIA